MTMNRILSLAAAALAVLLAACSGGKTGETVTFKGAALHTCGRTVEAGRTAPDFTATNGTLEEVRLSDFRGRRVVLNIFPSLDTPTCALTVRRFNEEASQLDNTVVLCLSMDLPFAQSRFCAAEGLDRVVPLSLFRSDGFAERYGLRLIDGPLKGLTARAVLVIDERGTVRHAQLVGEISEEPDYEAALRILRTH